MDGWFEIATGPAPDMVRLVMGGFYDAAAVDRLQAGLLDVHRRLRCPKGEHLTLCDITAMSIQSQEIVARFAALVGSPRLHSRRLAFVTGATLARMQAARLTDRSNVAFFRGEADALAWLSDERAQAA